ncbi:uncharacterized protein FIBRA_06599 [Fibroporia radiculosa]|uniref:Sodium/calcium exchanger membrane region domain-containing protein n=1 Tax=Fibroporia radiculosa TaxID=599839 RepID=J4HZD4_9APHY|nr:uncharacterized protein FIBRA_06599 [Fibroporia radiculosa]CCM04422.1 predicted protein [Fibroporia radiculosa]
MATITDHTPLLENNNGPGARSFVCRIVDMLKADGQPSWLASYRFFLFGSWLNALLMAIPLSFVAHAYDWDAAFCFTFSFIAIMPLAALLGTAMDQMSMQAGQTLSVLLNATFGNALELIVGFTALFKGFVWSHVPRHCETKIRFPDELRIVQTSMLGSILSNLLFVLGSSFLLGGFLKDSKYNETAAQVSCSLMTLTCITLVVPAAYHNAQTHGVGFIDGAIPTKTGYLIDGTNLDGDAEFGLRFISRGTSILLLLVYLGYIIFKLKTHAALFEAESAQIEEESQQMNIPAATLALLLVTVLTSFCANYLVASIEETAENYRISRLFIGLILLPIVENAAGQIMSIRMARKDKMEITIGICVGGAIQVSAFVIPLLVIIG